MKKHQPIEQKQKQPDNKNGRKKKRAGRIIRRTLLVLFILFLLLVLLGVTYIMGMDAWGSLDPEKILDVQQTLQIYDKNGDIVSSLYATQNRMKIDIHEVPQHVKDAVIATEDIRFYEHNGVDIRRIFGALWADIKAGEYVEGASTLTQQLVKLSHLTNEKTFARKLQEAVLAYQLEQRYTKDEILEMYMNFVYFGNGAYGIEAAAQSYFGKSARELTIDEGALLTGVLKSPTNYAPHIEPENALERRAVVIAQMEKYGFITTEQAEEANSKPLELVELDKGAYPYGYFADFVLSEAEKLINVSSEELLSGGYRVDTTLDPLLQAHCEEIYKDASLFPPDAADGVKCESAMIVLDSQTGDIRAVIGGREYSVRRGLNRAVQLERQPGSAIKPVLVYAPAMEQKQYTAATFILDEQTDFNGYMPKNFDGGFNGWVTMRQAVARSINIPAVKTFQDVGVDNGKSFAQQVGIPFEEGDDNLSLALGGFTQGISPLQMAGAYQPFVNGGSYRETGAITQITDSEGVVLYKREQKERVVMGEDNAFILTSMLQSAVKEGTGKRLADLNIPLAGKTGTSNLQNVSGNKDAWMTAYNPEYITCVWMGFDQPDEDHIMPSDATGGNYPAKVLSKFWDDLYPEGEIPPDFTKPGNVEEVRLDKKAMEERHKPLLASALTPPDQVIKEYFTQDTVPHEQTDYWVVPSPPTDFTVTPDTDGLPIISFGASDSFARYRVYRKVSGIMDEIMLGEFEPVDGRVQTKDTSAAYGATYIYHAVAVHPDMLVDGRQVQSAPSFSVTFTVLLPDQTVTPTPGFTIEPIITPTPEEPSPTQPPTPEPSGTQAPAQTQPPANTQQPAESPEPDAPAARQSDVPEQDQTPEPEDEETPESEDTPKPDTGMQWPISGN